MRSRVARAGVVVTATILPAVIVWLVIGAANPPHHDLSDIGTGLIQLGLGMLAAAIGFAGSLVATKPRP
ncbi:MAG: hypothetical protein ACRDVG_16620 [Jatrophihabitantaceae bacterium]